MFLLPTFGPDTTSGDEDVAIHLIATRTLVFHRRIPCVPVESFRVKHVLLRRAQPCQLRSNLMAVSLPNFAAFDVHADGNAGPHWKKWLARLERMFIGNEHYNSETKTSPAAPLCWSRRRWNIRHLTKHRRRQRL